MKSLRRIVYTLKLLTALWLFVIMTHGAFAQVIKQDSITQKIKDFTQFLLYRNHDSTYITSYADKLALKLLASNKFNSFTLIDGAMNSSVKYRPDRKLNLGVGVAYKWFALDLVFNFGIQENSDFENKESFDFQATVFGGKHYISGGYQYYFGYQMADLQGVPDEAIPNNDIRHDIRTASLELQYLFAYNYDQFSLKAPFIQNEIQRKSAGSMLFGAKFQFFTMDSDSSIIPQSTGTYFSENANLTNVLASSIGIRAGYMYTFVLKERFYITISAIPGINYGLGDQKTMYKSIIDNRFSFSMLSMNAIGYNSKKFFCGLMMTGELNRISLAQDLAMKHMYGKFKFHTGFRFH